MANVIVMSDSVCSLPAETVAELDIQRVPAANIYVNDTVYIDGETLSPDEAYELLEKDPDRFMTSALQPEYLLEKYEQIASVGNEILFITLSSALSALNRVARLTAETFMEQSPGVTLRVMDSKACSSTQGLVVLAAARAAAEGKSLDEVTAIAEQARQRAQGIMMLDTLRYVYRTGRMSKMASRIVSFFNIRPINRVTEEGKLEMVDKVRKRQDGLDVMLNYIEKTAESKDLHFILAHAKAPDMADHLAGMLKERFNCRTLMTTDFSPVMGYGAGPGALFIGYQSEI